MSTETGHVSTTGLQAEIQDGTGVTVNKCYQCGKCSAGCPLSEEMDFPPSFLMRMLQTGDPGLEEKVLRSFSIWVCLTCEMCYARCPMSIDIPQMMDYLRQKSLREKKVHPDAKKILAFHKSFLDSIKYSGRLYEIGLLVDYKARTLKIMQDMVLAPKMLLRGKLNIFPEMIRDRRGVASFFNKSNKKKS
ncbi:MAG TPA: 4Fe-4S dicluster domain-containing protein [Bacteroidales bacterium]|nr:4Fe-4S dicluster domain-containing protein [Bacteroidales bacterium]